jgi:hypothetical protein
MRYTLKLEIDRYRFRRLALKVGKKNLIMT